MRHFPVERTRELDLVIGVDPRVVLPTRDCDVGEALIDQLLARTLGVDLNQNTSRSLPLAAVARDRVPVIQMPSFARFERGRLPGVPPNLHLPLLVDMLHGAEL